MNSRTKGKARVRARHGTVGAVVLVALVMVVGVAVARRPDAHPVPRTIALADSPSGLVIDARTGRAFVLGDGYGPFGYRGNVTMLDLASGASLRTVPVGRVPAEMLLDQRANRLLVTDPAASTVSMLDASSGRLLHTAIVGAMQQGVQRIAVDTVTHRIFVSTMTLKGQLPFGGRVRVLDARTGIIVNTVAAGGGALIVDDLTGRVLVEGIGAGVSMLDARTGRVLRVIPLAAGSLAVDRRSGHIFVASATRLSMLDARTGQVLHTTSMGMATTNLLLTVDEADERVLVRDDVRYPPYSGTVRVVDARHGTLISTVAVGSPSSPGGVAIDGSYGRAFVANSPAGTVSMLDVRRGVVRKTIAVGAHPVMLAVDERRRRLVCISASLLSAGSATSPGRMSVLDVRSGAVLSSVTIGWGPTAVALDERMGRALIANVGGVMRLPDTWAWVPPWLRGWLPFLPPPESRTRLVPGSVSMVDITR